MLKETIVVEGKKDAAAVRRAVDADIITTSGFGINKEIIELIKIAQEKRGVIILTDPDFMGEKIRRIIADRVDGVKHAFIPKEDAIFERDIGVENASPETISLALTMAKRESKGGHFEFSIMDLVDNQLANACNAASNRNKVGKILGIGYGNAKQFLNRLNRYGISRQEFNKAIEAIGGE